MVESVEVEVKVEVESEALMLSSDILEEVFEDGQIQYIRLVSHEQEYCANALNTDPFFFFSATTLPERKSRCLVHPSAKGQPIPSRGG